MLYSDIPSMMHRYIQFWQSDYFPLLNSKVGSVVSLSVWCRKCLPKIKCMLRTKESFGLWTWRDSLLDIFSLRTDGENRTSNVTVPKPKSCRLRVVLWFRPLGYILAKVNQLRSGPAMMFKRRIGHAPPINLTNLDLIVFHRVVMHSSKHWVTSLTDFVFVWEVWPIQQTEKKQ